MNKANNLNKLALLQQSNISKGEISYASNQTKLTIASDKAGERATLRAEKKTEKAKKDELKQKGVLLKEEAKNIADRLKADREQARRSKANFRMGFKMASAGATALGYNSIRTAKNLTNVDTVASATGVPARTLRILQQEFVNLGYASQEGLNLAQTADRTRRD